MRRIAVLMLVLACGSMASGLEVVRQKNVATVIIFPIVDADGDFVTGAADLDAEIETWSDGVNPNGWTNCATNVPTEIGTSGWYYLPLAQAETNVQYAAIQVKTSTAGAKTQGILIRTTVGDPSLMSTTTAGTVSAAQSGDVYDYLVNTFWTLLKTLAVKTRP